MIRDFCKSCPYFRDNDQTATPRPLGEAIHGTRTKEGLHFDLIKTQALSAKSNCFFLDLLIVKDGVKNSWNYSVQDKLITLLSATLFFTGTNDLESQQHL